MSASDFDPCPKGDPECLTGDDGSCHDACEAPAGHDELRAVLGGFGRVAAQLKAERGVASDEPRELSAIDYDKVSGTWSTRKMTAEEKRDFQARRLRDQVRELVTVDNAQILAAVLAEVARLETQSWTPHEDHLGFLVRRERWENIIRAETHKFTRDLQASIDNDGRTIVADAAVGIAALAILQAKRLKAGGAS